jgi:hypothetical protein
MVVDRRARVKRRLHVHFVRREVPTRSKYKRQQSRRLRSNAAKNRRWTIIDFAAKIGVSGTMPTIPGNNAIGPLLVARRRETFCEIQHLEQSASSR